VVPNRALGIVVDGTDGVWEEESVVGADVLDWVEVVGGVVGDKLDKAVVFVNDVVFVELADDFEANPNEPNAPS
jgi:hypothetical protein